MVDSWQQKKTFLRSVGMEPWPKKFNVAKIFKYAGIPLARRFPK